MSSDGWPTELDIERTAKLLCAADVALCDGLAPHAAYSHAERQWDALNEEPWKDGKHCGDCTKAPMPCARCHVEAYIAEAKARAES